MDDRDERTDEDESNVPVDDDCRRERESKFLTFAVNESRLARGRGDDVMCLEFNVDDVEEILTTVVKADDVPAAGDDPVQVATGLLEIGMEELRKTLSIDAFRRESGR